MPENFLTKIIEIHLVRKLNSGYFNSFQWKDKHTFFKKRSLNKTKCQTIQKLSEQ